MKYQKYELYTVGQMAFEALLSESPTRKGFAILSGTKIEYWPEGVQNMVLDLVEIQKQPGSTAGRTIQELKLILEKSPYPLVRLFVREWGFGMVPMRKDLRERVAYETKIISGLAQFANRVLVCPYIDPLLGFEIKKIEL